jgi:hypothetical protein
MEKSFCKSAYFWIAWTFQKKGTKSVLITDLNVRQHQNRVKTINRWELCCGMVDVLLSERFQKNGISIAWLYDWFGWKFFGWRKFVRRWWSRISLTTNSSLGGAQLLPRIEKTDEWLNKVAIENESSFFCMNLRESGRVCVGNPQPHTVPGKHISESRC